MELIDTHSHIYEPEFDDDREEVLRRALENGVTALLLPAIDPASDERLFALSHNHPDCCFPMMGLHPTSINDNPSWRQDLQRVEQYLNCPPEGISRFYGVGEIGLDFYWDDRFVAEQTEAFIAQLHLAARLDLPAVIHTRAAWDRMTEIIETEARRIHDAGGRLRGVFHAFAEELETYERLRRCGEFLFGIGGVVTFKKSKLADTVREMRLDDLVLETDCPYLTPVPHRGERNESAYVRFVCEKVAQVKGITPDQVATATTANARRLFFDKCADRREP